MINIGIFASGTEDGGGSGAGVLLEKISAGQIKVNGVTIVSNHEKGGVYGLVETYKEALDKLGIGLDFHHIEKFPSRSPIPPWEGEFTPQDLFKIKLIVEKIMQDYNLDYAFLSGFMKYLFGLPTDKTVNIHPGPTQEPYGGKRMYGHHVHDRVWQDYQVGTINRTCVTMHFVNNELDRGPIICQIPVEIDDCESAGDVAKKVNKAEHEWQWKITKMVAEGSIRLSEQGIVEYPDHFRWGNELDLTHTGEENEELFMRMQFRFDELFGKLGIKEEQQKALFEKIYNHHTETHRSYHTLDHLEKFITFIEQYEGEIQDKDALLVSVWFHDIIYNPESHDNEEQSAELAKKELHAAGFKEAFIQRVVDLIITTKSHEPIEGDEDSKVFLDGDLSILASPSKEYDEYTKKIREEYFWYSDADYANGRIQILKRFLERERIFFTDAMHTQHETTARENLNREIQKLEKSL